MPRLLSSLPVGAKVKDTQTTYNGKPILFAVMEHNHAGDPAGSTALVASNIITLKCFDAKEPRHAGSTGRASSGNNRYLYSNLAQWLNSDKAAGQWYVAQHEADEPPSSAYVQNNRHPYDQEAGFLTNFSTKLKQSLMTVTKRVAKSTLSDGGGYEDITQKIFLLSNTEVGLSNENYIAEGTIYALFSNSQNVRAYPTAEAVAKSEWQTTNLAAGKEWQWWLRTPYASFADMTRAAYLGALSANNPYSSTIGVRPACVVSSSISVSDTTDTDGAYTMVWNTPPVISTSTENLGDKNTPFSIQYQITDTDGDTVNATVRLDETTVATHNPVNKSAMYTYSVTKNTLNGLSIGSHKITITATDELGESTTKEIKFNKIASNIVISGEDTELGEKWIQPSYSYSVSDNAGNSVTVTEMIDNEEVRKIENADTSGDISFSFDGFTELGSDENHTACIKAENTDGTIVYRYISFRKIADRLEFETKPVETDAPAERIVVSVKYDTTGDPDLKVEVTNSACSDVQIWEDATDVVNNKKAYRFQNQIFDNGKYGIAVRVTIKKNESTPRVYCYGLGICFD